MNYKENEILTPEVFQFSATKQDVRSLLVWDEPWLVAKDVCDILAISNNRDAIKNLDEDEKLMSVISTSGQKRSMWLINESGFFALVMKSTKPEAKSFRKWVTSEVLPSIRKKGYYGSQKKESDFIDARDMPYNRRALNNFTVRCIDIEGLTWFSLNDIHSAIGSSTASNQAAKKLNKKQTLARKIWIFGNTHQAWFTTLLGFELLMSGSRLKPENQLKLNFGGQV